MQNLSSKKEHIEKICNEGYELEFGKVIENSFANYKKIAVYAGCMFIVFVILLGILSSLGLVSSIGLENFKPFMDQFQAKMVSKSLDTIMTIQLSSVLISVLTTPFIAGFYKMCHFADKDEEFKVVDMFSYYKAPYLLNITFFTLIIGLLTVALTFVTESIGMGFIASFSSSMVSILSLLAIPLIVFGNLNATEAIKYSFKLVSRKFFLFLGILIVSLIIAGLGIFGFCIGIFFTIPFFYSVHYVLYKTIVGIDETSEIDEISGVQN